MGANAGQSTEHQHSLWSFKGVCSDTGRQGLTPHALLHSTGITHDLYKGYFKKLSLDIHWDKVAQLVVSKARIYTQACLFSKSTHSPPPTSYKISCRRLKLRRKLQVKTVDFVIFIKWIVKRQAGSGTGGLCEMKCKWSNLELQGEAAQGDWPCEAGRDAEQTGGCEWSRGTHSG